MVFVLSEATPPNCINHVLQAQVFDEYPTTILNKVNRLEFRSLSVTETDISFPLIEYLELEEPILAINKFQHPNVDGDCLLLLTESYVLLVLWYDHDQNKFVVLKSMTFDASNQQLPADMQPKIVVDPSEFPKFFAVYFFEGFLQIFSINHEWQRLESASSRSKRKLDHSSELMEGITVSVGSIVVQDLQILYSSSENLQIIAVLYRDYSYNYSMRYYQISKKSFTLIHQFEEFEEVPTLLVPPMSGGVMILTDAHIFYFPGPNIKKLELSDDNNDGNISINPRDLVITKKLFTNSISAFCCCRVIDNKRILLANNKGDTFVLFFDWKKAGHSTIKVLNISFINLGLTTVPVDILHITENYFFIASKLSQSMVVKVLPQHPFLEILKIIDSSPPVLDIDIGHFENGYELFTCQGGYESGEFRKWSSGAKTLRCVKHFLSEVHPEQIFNLNQSSEKGIFKLHENSKEQLYKLDLESLELQPLEEESRDVLGSFAGAFGIHGDSVTIDGNNIVKWKVQDSSHFVVVDNTNTIHVCSNGKFLNIKTTCDQEVSDVDIVSTSEFESLVLVTFWNGSYEFYVTTDSEYELAISEALLPNETPISSCCIVHNPALYADSAWLLFLSSNSSVVELFFNFKELTKDTNKLVIGQFGGLPYKFARGEDDVFMFNNKRVFLIQHNKLLNLNSICSVNCLPPGVDINHLWFLGKSLVAISSSSSDVFIYNIEEKRKADDILFSNSFNVKSLKVGPKHSLILSSKNAFVESQNDYTRNSFLQLINTKEMKQISELEYPESSPVEIVDLCILDSSNLPFDVPSSKSKYILGLCNSTEVDKILRVFEIDGGKIEEMGPVKLQGLLSTDRLSNHCIKLLDATNNFYALCGVMNYTVQPRSLLEWAIVPSAIYQGPVFTIACNVLDNCVVIADVMKGINCVPFSIDEDSLKFTYEKALTYLDTNFVTAMDVFDSSSGKLNLISDSYGNLSGVVFGTSEANIEEVISYNIGDPVNIIKRLPEIQPISDFTSEFDNLQKKELYLNNKAILGTVNGGLYLLSELNDTDEEMEGILDECCKELLAFNDPLSSYQPMNKKERVNKLLSNRERKLLQQDEAGQFMRKSQKTGVIDLTLIQRWLDSDISLEEHYTSLKKCYRNKSLLQRIVFEAYCIHS